jgi:RNA polymerase sigma factor (sigma-70 family)
MPMNLINDTHEQEHLGDQATFADLVRRHQDAAFAYAYAILRDRSAAEDATQAAFLTAWVHRKAVRDLAAFGAWLRTIVRTECYRAFRRERLSTVPLDLNSASIDTPVHDAVIGTWELQQLLARAVGRLPEPDRVVISMKYLSDLSYEEMGQFLNLPLTTVKKRLHDARKRLRTSLEAVTTPRGKDAVRDCRPSSRPHFTRRIMHITGFLELVARGDTTGVGRALDDDPALLNAPGALPEFSVSGANALYLAAACGQVDVVKLLLARGASLAETSTTGVSPMAAAAIENRHQIVRLLLDAGVEMDIYAAAAFGDAARVNALLTEEPSRLHEQNVEGRTPLHFARSIAVADALIRAGAEIDATDAYGMTPLQWIAATGRYKELCAYLRDRGSRAAATDIFWACTYGDAAAVQHFLDADPLLVNTRRSPGPDVPTVAIGSTPLHEAAARGERDIVVLLLQRGANVHARAGQHQGSALHAAAAGGHRETIEVLLAAAADRDAKDASFNATAAQGAEAFGHAELVELLTA